VGWIDWPQSQAESENGRAALLSMWGHPNTPGMINPSHNVESDLFYEMNWLQTHLAYQDNVKPILARTSVEESQELLQHLAGYMTKSTTTCAHHRKCDQMAAALVTRKLSFQILIHDGQELVAHPQRQQKRVS
jgi:hypothetical protein